MNSCLKNELTVNDISYAIGKKYLLNNISLKISSGEICSIIGPNGAGKSTLIRAISGDVSPSSGTIFIKGKNRSNWLARDLASTLAMLPQNSQLNFPFTVAEVVAMARLPHNTSAEQNKNIVYEVMEKLEVLNLQNQLYTQLSGGEKQRVQLARVIAQVYPLEQMVGRFLVLDEPCNGLDLKHQLLLAGFLLELSQHGLAIILCEHDLNWLASFSKTVVCLREGQCLKSGDLKQVLQPDLLRQVFDVDMDIVYSDENRGVPTLKPRALVK